MERTKWFSENSGPGWSDISGGLDSVKPLGRVQWFPGSVLDPVCLPSWPVVFSVPALLVL